MESVTDAQLFDITGNFHEPDIGVFRALLDATADELGGDLAEMGVFYGRSAVLIGASCSPTETFTVIDLFGDEANDDHNQAENGRSYPGLTREKFEENYRGIHGRLPQVLQGPSESIVKHAGHGTHRFVHVDASHLYPHVVADIEAARTLLKQQGVLVLDDIRQQHTPGVAAAAWQEVLKSDLRPFAITPYKLYATWGDGGRWRDVIEESSRSGPWTTEHQTINGHDLLRLGSDLSPAMSTEHPAKKFVPPVLWPRLRRWGQRAGLVADGKQRS